MSTDQASRPRSVVLVHGMWGVPGDWQWVQRLLEEHGVQVSVADLPSHRRSDAGLLDDVEEVRAMLRTAGAPTVAVGWSYGCDVIGVAAAGEPNVARLVYVSSVPLPLHPGPRDGSIFDDSPIIDWVGDDRFVISDAWRVGRDFAPEVWAFADANPKRPVTRRTLTDPIAATAWAGIPTTVLLGTRDDLFGAQARAFAREAVRDVREFASDHFIPFSLPGLVAGVILEEIPTRTD